MSALQSWPRCDGCGGPAYPHTAPTLVVEFDVVTASEANARDKWGKIKRAIAAREATTEALSDALTGSGYISNDGPWYVRITRRSPSRLDTDNCARAMKAIRDCIAAALHVDDGSASVEWSYAQAKGKPLGCMIEIWSCS